MTIFTELLTVAALRDNYEIDATGTTTLWPTDKLYKAEVPAGKRWFFICGSVDRNVSSTCTIRIHNNLDEVVTQLCGLAAATGIASYPSTDDVSTTLSMGSMIPMDPGWYVAMVFGTSQDASTYASALVLEVDL